MPYLQEGGETANSQYVAAGPRLVVEPGKILELKRRLEARRDEIRRFVNKDFWRLVQIDAPGADPCSEETVKFLAENGKAAQDAAQGFLAELTSVVEQLDRIAAEYRLVEENNAGKLSGPR